MALPTTSVRLPRDLHPLLHRIARALKADPETAAPTLEAALEGLPAPAAEPATPDVMQRIAALEVAVADLRARLGQGAPAADQDRQVGAGATPGDPTTDPDPTQCDPAMHAQHSGAETIAVDGGTDRDQAQHADAIPPQCSLDDLRSAVRARIEATGSSASAMAKAIGVGRSAVADFLSGRRPGSGDLHRRLTGWLGEGEGPDRPNRPS